MDPAQSLRQGCYDQLDGGNVAGWRQHSLIYADWLDDEGEAAKARLRRRKALTRRSPGCRWPRAGLIAGITPHQREHLGFALRQPLGILSGTPGCGKTFVTAAVLRELTLHYGSRNLAACAPTGKAAVRLTEGLRRNGVSLIATTIHQLLEIGRNGHDGDGWGFRRNETNTLDKMFVVVDEASMLDVDLFGHLLRACPTGAHVLLVGDPNQLPPVGHGAPLRDLILAGLPHGQLSEIHRNAGLIVLACDQIRQGKRFEVCDRFSPEQGLNLRHIEARTPDEQIDKLMSVLARLRISGRFDLSQDVQILAAVNTSGLLARVPLNRLLQAELNDQPSVPGNIFRVGDKAICLRNHWALTQDGDRVGPEAYVANGEMGRVVQAEATYALITFTDPPRLIRVQVGAKKPDADKKETDAEPDFDLAYAITTHKSQGSEFPVVIVLADPSPGARRVCSREWLYTAISRASQLCITIGRLGVLQQMVHRPTLMKRKTFLVELLQNR